MPRKVIESTGTPRQGDPGRGGSHIPQSKTGTGIHSMYSSAVYVSTQYCEIYPFSIPLFIHSPDDGNFMFAIFHCKRVIF